MMRNGKHLVAVCSGIIFAGEIAFATELSPSKRAPMHNILPNSYGKAEISHHFKHLDESNAARVDATYTLGSTFFEKALDVYVTLGVKKYAKQSHISQKSTDFELDYTAFSNDYLTIQPYLLGSGPYKDSKDVSHSTEGRFGLLTPIQYELATTAGVLTFGAEYDMAATYSTKPQKVALINATSASSQSHGLAPRESAGDELEPSPTVETQALGLRQVGAAKLAYTPNFVQGFSIEWKTSHKVIGTPKMHLNTKTQKPEQQESSLGLPAYQHQGATTHRLRLAYTFNDTFSLQNDFTLLQKPTVEGKLRYSNTMGISANLF